MAEQNFCMLINSLAEGGAEKVVATLLPEFQQQGQDVPLICLVRNDVHKIEGAQITYLSSQTGSSEGFIKKFVSLFLFAYKLKKYIKANHICLVQSHIYRANYVNVLAKLMAAGHQAQLVNHGIPEQYRMSGIAGAVNQRLIRWLYPRADEVICPSLGMMNSLQQMGVAREKLKHLPNPVDEAEIRKLGSLAVSNDSFKFEPDRKYFIAIGRLEPVKSTQDIIAAFAQIAGTYLRLELIILGSGSQENQLTKLARNLGIAERVHLLGRVENPYQYLSRCEVFINASETEGFSLVIVEALTLGIPVISTDCAGGPRDILAPGESFTQISRAGDVRQVEYGIFVHPHDVMGLAKAMTILLVDEHLRQQYASKGKQHSQGYDKVKTAGRYLQSIYQLMDAA